MPVSDYYKVLGVDRATDLDGIKSAYRVLALKSHPDSNTTHEAKDTYQQVAEAYHVLSNSERKAVYDQFGIDGLKKGVPARDGFSGYGGNYSFHGNADEVFNNFFGTKNPFVDFFATTTEPKEAKFGAKFGGLQGMTKSVSNSQPVQDPEVKFDLNLTLEQLFNGTLKKIKVNRKVLNEDGATTRQIEKILTIEVPAGTKEGTRVVFPREGDQGPNSIPADIVFVIRALPHDTFKRKGSDLILESEISLVNALTGLSIDVKTLDGRLLKIPINDTISPEYVKVVKGEGFANKDKTRGDLHIKFKTVFPSVLTEQQKNLLKQAFSK